MTRKNLAALLLVTIVAICNTALAQKESAPKAPDRLALAKSNATEILFLMDTDKNGKISKQEWLNFMSAEFDRLDQKKSGELDPKELLRTSVMVHPVRSQDAGK